MFKQFKSLRSFQEKRGIVDKIIKELSQHAAVEEQYLYPLVRNTFKSSNGDKWADRSLDEHQEVKNLLYSLEKMDENDSQLDSTVEKVEKSVNAHVQEEEQEIFPALQRAISAQDLAKLEDALDGGKAMAPTHPHPMAPNKPPYNYMNAAAGVMDQIRDTVTGRKM